MADHAGGDETAKSAERVDREIWRLRPWSAKIALVAQEEIRPEASMRIRTAPRAMTVAIRPASPKLRISSELENSKAMNETAAVAWVRTQAGPTIKIAFRKASYLF